MYNKDRKKMSVSLSFALCLVAISIAMMVLGVFLV